MIRRQHPPAHKSNQMRLWHWKPTPYHLVFLCCLIIALSAAAPIWGPGIINTRGGGDSPFLLQRTLDMAENIKHGGFPPRWMAHAAYDYGYPFFNHYGALPFYISGGLTVVGFPVIVAIQSTQTLGFVLAAFAMALWADQLYKNHWATILAVAAYTYVPFHLVNVYVRGDSLSEFYAFIWFPLILWALQRFIKHPSWSRVLIAASVYGGLILTHNTSAVAFSPFALLYALMITLKYRGISRNIRAKALLVRYLIPVITPFLLGLVLTMWFWLPALAETGYGQLGPDFTEGYFHHSQHYRGLNLVQLSPAFNYSIALETGDPGPFSMGFIQSMLAFCGVLTMWRSKQKNAWLKIYLLISLVLATLMMTPLSSFLWDNIPLLSVTQFPWRFLSVQAVYTAAITATIPISILKRSIRKAPITRYIRKTRWCATVAAIFLLMGAAFIGLRPDRLRINSEDVTWNNLMLYETFTGNIGTTIRHEYLPKDVVPRPYITQAIVDGEILPKVDGTSDMHARLLDRSPLKQSWQIRVDKDPLHPQILTTIVFPLYWWPSWQAKMDGTRLTAYAFSGSGQLALDIPDGTHDIILTLHRTKLQSIALMTSYVAVALLSVRVYLEIRSSQQNFTGSRLRSTAALLLIVAIPLIVPVLWYRPIPDEGRFFDFDQMPFPHAGPIDFELATLNHIATSTDSASPGEKIGLHMQWSLETTEPLTATISIVSPAQHRHNVSYTLMETQIILAPSIVVDLQLPDDLSRGLYLIQLRVYAFQIEIGAKTPEGRGMGALFIGTIRVPDGPKISPSLTASTPEPLAQFTDLDLYSLVAYQSATSILNLKMMWATPGTPRNWNLSLRLLDVSGYQITQRDTQPGYGYLPTSMWHPEEIIYDYLQLEIPEGLAPGDYVVRIIAYLQATMEIGGEVDIPIRIEKPTYYDLRDACCEQTRKGATILCQTGGVALLGIESPATINTGDNLSFTAEWNAMQTPTPGITAKWVLVKSDNTIAHSVEQPLAVGSDTAFWPMHTWVLNHIQMEFDPLLESGNYQLQLIMNDGITEREPCIVKEIAVLPRARIYTVPSLPHAQQAIFNDEIKLLGYDTTIKKAQQLLEITLWWQAERVPGLDYKRFVHLYDSAENKVISQDDAMPRGWTYPTTWWSTSEIVSETITISLQNIPKGTYRLGVGWYDPATLIRLHAYSIEGEYIEDNRVTLSIPIKVR